MPGLKDLIEAGKLAWDNRALLLPALAHIRKWWKAQRVLLIGPGGTGKTTLARLLAGETNWLTDDPWAYQESYVTERLRMKPNQFVEMVVAPGQKDRRPATWGGVEADLASGRYKGVILVSAFGYHTPAAGQRVLTGRPKKDVLQKYLAGARADAVAVLRRLGEVLQACPKPVWLLSVVAKQDLWLPDADECRAHYTTGEYGDALRTINDHLGAGRFRHECEFVSLVISNFTTPQDGVVKQNVAGYDQQAQVESVRRLFDVIAQLIAGETR